MKIQFTKSSLLAVAAILVFNAPFPAEAFIMQGEHLNRMGNMMHGEHLNKMGGMMGMEMCLEHAEKLGLSAAQVAKIKPLHSDMLKKDARFTADLKIAELELLELLEVKDYDLEKTSQSVKKISTIVTDHHLDMLKTMKELRAVMTEDQFEAMKKHMAMKPEVKKLKKKQQRKP